MKDTGFQNPIATGNIFDQWINPENAYLSNNQYTWIDDLGARQDWSGFSFLMPYGSKILGIEVSVEGQKNIFGCGCGVELSWDAGRQWTTTGKTYTWPFGAEDFILFFWRC